MKFGSLLFQTMSILIVLTSLSASAGSLCLPGEAAATPKEEAAPQLASDRRLVFSEGRKSYTFPGCIKAAKNTAQSKSWKGFFNSQIDTLKELNVRQDLFARLVNHCLGSGAASLPKTCPKINNLVDDVIPKQFKRAREELLLASGATTLSPLQPNADMRSPEGREIESWEPATPDEVSAAMNHLQTYARQVDQEMATDLKKMSAERSNYLSPSRIASWQLQTRKEAIRLTRQRNNDSYLSILRSYPILLRLKSDKLDRESIAKAARDTLPAIQKRDDDLEQIRASLNETGTKELKEKLFTDIGAVAKTLEEKPEYCDLVEDSIDSDIQWGAAKGAGMIVGGVFLGLRFPKLATTAAAVSIPYDVKSYFDNTEKIKESLGRHSFIGGDDSGPCLEQLGEAKKIFAMSALANAAFFVRRPRGLK